MIASGIVRETNMKPAGTSKVFKTRRMAAAVLAATLLVYGCGGAEERQADYYQRAQDLFDEGNYQKARIEVRNVLQINPNNAEIGRASCRAREELPRPGVTLRV